MVQHGETAATQPDAYLFGATSSSKQQHSITSSVHAPSHGMPGAFCEALASEISQTTNGHHIRANPKLLQPLEIRSRRCSPVSPTFLHLLSFVRRQAHMPPSICQKDQGQIQFHSEGAATSHTQDISLAARYFEVEQGALRTTADSHGAEAEHLPGANSKNPLQNAADDRLRLRP